MTALSWVSWVYHYTSPPLSYDFIVVYKWDIPSLFFLFTFVFSTVDGKYVHCKMLLMSGFEPWTSGIGINHSANWAATAALILFTFVFSTVNGKYVHCKMLLMSGFEPWTSGIGSDRSANWATTAVHYMILLFLLLDRRKMKNKTEMGLLRQTRRRASSVRWRWVCRWHQWESDDAEIGLTQVNSSLPICLLDAAT